MYSAMWVYYYSIFNESWLTRSTYEMDIVSSSFEEIKLGRYEFWAGRDKCSTLSPPKISLKRSLLHQYIPYNPHPKKVPAKQNKLNKNKPYAFI